VKSQCKSLLRAYGILLSNNSMSSVVRGLIPHVSHHPMLSDIDYELG
jgi:hypothetical protein